MHKFNETVSSMNSLSFPSHDPFRNFRVDQQINPQRGSGSSKLRIIKKLPLVWKLCRPQHRMTTPFGSQTIWCAVHSCWYLLLLKGMRYGSRLHEKSYHSTWGLVIYWLLVIRLSNAVIINLYNLSSASNSCAYGGWPFVAK